MEKIRTNIIRLLKEELGYDYRVMAYQDQVLINISRTDLENRLGYVLQLIYRVIEQHFPERPDHLAIIIRNEDTRYENVFKVWRSV